MLHMYAQMLGRCSMHSDGDQVPYMLLLSLCPIWSLLENNGYVFCKNVDERECTPNKKN